MKDLAGICTPICTPFTDDGSALDESRLLDHIDWLIEAGVNIIAVCGGTGEFPFLTTEEKRRIIEVSGRHIDGRAGLIAQTSAIRTEEAIEASKHAQGAGADCLLVLPPYFEGPDERGVAWHYERVAGAVSVPIMAYNIPQYSDFDVTPDLMRRLGETAGIRTIKDSTGDMLRIEQLVAAGFKVFNGCDYLSFYGLLAGCAGCFWGGSNAMPAQAVALYRHCAAGETAEAAALWERMKAANLFFWSHAFNPSIKAACGLIGRPMGECRKPVMPLSTADLAALETAMAPLLR